MNEIKVSIVVCTYNSDIEQLKRTLFSAIFQQNIDFEIIITDDGTENFNKKELEKFFDRYEFEQYKIITHSMNMGTVSNYYDGLLHSSGEYIAGISPGDFFYSSLVVSELYEFCMSNKCEMCFGEAISYQMVDGQVEFRKFNSPKWPYSFNKGMYNTNIALISFLFGHQPIGATYFRKKEIAVKYFAEIVGKVKYVEDYSTTTLFLLDGMRMYYYGHPIVWYECSSGISNCGSSIWKQRLNDDFNSIKEIILSRHGNNKIVQVLYTSNKLERLRQPYVCAVWLILKILGNIRHKVRKIVGDVRYFEMIVQYHPDYSRSK